VVSLVQAVRKAFANMDRAVALVVFILGALGTAVSGAWTWIADWYPTWKFANGDYFDGGGGAMDYSADGVVREMVRIAEETARMLAGMGTLSLSMFLTGAMAVGITLFPTILQFIAPRIVHPAADFLSRASIWFDLVTDLPQAWMQAEGVVEFYPARALVALGLALFYSVILQVIFVLCLVATATAIGVLISGERPSRAPQARVVEGV
jgi:hypothetical protein